MTDSVTSTSSAGSGWNSKKDDELFFLLKRLDKINIESESGEAITLLQAVVELLESEDENI